MSPFFLFYFKQIHVLMKKDVDNDVTFFKHLSLIDSKKDADNDVIFSKHLSLIDS